MINRISNLNKKYIPNQLIKKKKNLCSIFHCIFIYLYSKVENIFIFSIGNILLTNVKFFIV